MLIGIVLAGAVLACCIYALKEKIEDAEVQIQDSAEQELADVRSYIAGKSVPVVHVFRSGKGWTTNE